MKYLVFALTLPIWLPVLFAVGSASVALGMTVVVAGAVFRDRPTKDNWDESELA